MKVSPLSAIGDRALTTRTAGARLSICLAVGLLLGTAHGVQRYLHAASVIEAAVEKWHDQERSAPLDSNPATEKELKSAQVLSDSYVDAIRLIQDRSYSDDLRTGKNERTRALTYEAIKGMLASLKDPYSYYLDSMDWKQMITMTDGQFGGIGVVMEKDRSANTIRITRPVAGGPAERAGIRSRDVVLTIDHHSVAGKTLDDLAPWVEGDVGTAVDIEILRDGIRHSYKLLRADIEPPVVQSWMEDASAHICRIVLTEFNRKSAGQIYAAYATLERQGVKALVLDLRFNPGGLLDAAVDVASIFVPLNANPSLNNNVVIIHYGDGEEEGMKLHAPISRHRSCPLVVLVNGHTASAAEVVTGCIKDYRVGTIMGERTYGKGKVQTLFEMNHGSDGGIRLTTSLYYPPAHYDINYKHDDAGHRISGTGGIVPNIAVPSSPAWTEQFEDRRNDAQLSAALGYLRNQLGRTGAVPLH